MRVLDVAAGTGNASIVAAQRGASVTASDLTPELLDAGRARAESEGVELEWVEADAENLPFEDGSYDVVMSSIGAMFAPHHQDVADELVRVCRPGGTIGLLSWTPEGMIGALFRTMGPFAPPPPPGAQPPPLWGSEDHLRELFGDRVEWGTLERDNLEIDAFEHPRDWGEHFKDRYGPTIATYANAAKNGQEAELDEALMPSARSGTSARTTTPASSRSTWSRSAPGPDGVGSGPVGAARGVVPRPGDDLVRAADDLAVVGLEHGHHALAAEPADLRALRVHEVGQHAPAVDLLDVGLPAGLLQRLVGVPAGMPARARGGLEGSPADVELHGRETLIDQRRSRLPAPGRTNTLSPTSCSSSDGSCTSRTLPPSWRSR